MVSATTRRVQSNRTKGMGMLVDEWVGGVAGNLAGSVANRSAGKRQCSTMPGRTETFAGESKPLASCPGLDTDSRDGRRLAKQEKRRVSRPVENVVRGRRISPIAG